MPVPEWTIVDFIHRGPWWQNRGEFRPTCARSHNIGELLKLQGFHPGIRLLNIYLFLPLLTAPINGFDSSLVNGTFPYSLSYSCV